MGEYQPFRISSTPYRSPSWHVGQIVLSFFAAIILAFGLNLFVFQSYYVDGESMSPTLHSNDRLIISKVERSTAHAEGKPYIPKRGQIIVIDGTVSPQTEEQAPHLIKRVVGTPGDRIVISGDGKVMISNSGSPQGFNANEELGLKLDPTFGQGIDVTVPDGFVYVLGDNRTQGGSYDSRAFGMVNSEFIQGRLLLRILPTDSTRVF